MIISNYVKIIEFRSYNTRVYNKWTASESLLPSMCRSEETMMDRSIGGRSIDISCLVRRCYLYIIILCTPKVVVLLVLLVALLEINSGIAIPGSSCHYNPATMTPRLITIRHVAEYPQQDHLSLLQRGEGEIKYPTRCRLVRCFNFN